MGTTRKDAAIDGHARLPTSTWSRDVASRLAVGGSFARGVAYALDRRVEGLEGSNRRFTATVRGSRPYRVVLSGTASDLAWSCDCPVGEDGTFCKHCVAVALVVAGADPEQLTGRADDVDAVRAYLEGLDRALLIDLVAEQAQRDDPFRERLRVRAAAASGNAIDVRDRRRRLKKAFGSGRFIDYREAPGWAAGVDEALLELEDLLDAGYAAAVVDLVEYAHGRAEKAMQHVDDSDGWITGISSRLADLHVRACAAGAIDPVLLARRLVDLELSAELDTFHRAALAYADVLGPVGIDEYRRLIEPRFAQLGGDEDWSHERFRTRNARIGVALAAADPDELIAVKSDDLRLPDDYAEIARLLAGSGRADEAVSWCKRGLAEHADRQRQLGPLRELLAQLHRDRDDVTAAVDVFWAGFEQLPSLDGYRRLVREAAQVDERARRQTAAIEYLKRSLDDAVRARSEHQAHNVAATIVEVLLFEGDIDEAWRFATEHECAQRLWMQLAWARERAHPEDAIPIYEREIETLIEKKNDSGYRAAVKLMAHVESLQARLERTDAFADFIERVRSVHGRKTNLMRRVAAKGW